MGKKIIDVENMENILRCNYVKIPIVLINIIGAPLSLIFLLICIIRMIYKKKKLSFLTRLILIIFFSEIVNTISKLLQLLKYCFDDLRKERDKSIGRDTPRGIICQIQIVTSIFSDYCSLLCTLLLSLRCYDVIRNKKRFFDKTKNRVLSIILVIIVSISFSIGFLFIDRYRTEGNDSYRYDVRDRCSYWCWLDHDTSLICFGIYCFILILNIYFACKTNCSLKKGYKKLIEDNTYIEEKNSMDTPLNDIGKDLNSKNNSSEKVEKKIILSKEEQKRIEQLNLMRIKCKIYPNTTIIIWSIVIAYRFIDDLFMEKFDSEDMTPEEGTEEEKKFFTAHFAIQIIVQISLVLHTILSTLRGIFYGLSFIVFEEKAFYDCFKKCLKKFKKNDYLIDNEEDKKGIIRNTENSSSTYENNKNDEEDKERDSNFVEERDTFKERNIEMNTSDCH